MLSHQLSMILTGLYWGLMLGTACLFGGSIATAIRRRRRSRDAIARFNGRMTELKTRDWDRYTSGPSHYHWHRG